MSEPKLNRIEKPNVGFAIHIPVDWREEPPNLANSPHEVARFYERGATSRGVIVFRQVRGTDVVTWANDTQETLEVSGYTSFSKSEWRLADLPGIRLDFAMADHTNGAPWAVREYFVVSNGIGYCFGFGSNTLADDGNLFDDIAREIELFEPKVAASLPNFSFANWSPRPRRAFGIGQDLAQRVGEQMGEQHILLGLAEIGEGAAYDALLSAGTDPERLRRAFARARGSRPKAHDEIAVTAGAYRVVATAAPQHAATLGHTYIGTEHLLLGIVASEHDLDGACALLDAAGADKQAIRNALADQLEKVIETVVRGVEP